MKSIICDTNIILKLLIIEPDSQKAETLYKYLIDKNFYIIAPNYLKIELYSILLKALSFKRIDDYIFDKSLIEFPELTIDYFANEKLLESSVKLAKNLKEASIYDSIFLALSIQENAIFVTADNKFAKKAKRIYKKVYNLEEALELFKL